MRKQLDIIYHTQINNKILPYVTCGVTCLAEYIHWINKKFNKTYVCNDDKLMEILNSEALTNIAKDLIKKGIIDASALKIRIDNLKTKDIDESKFNHTNNFKPMLSALGGLVTKGEFNFKTEYLTIQEIDKSIDDEFPVQISAKFTSGGHFVLIVGYDTEKRSFIVDDPYGNWTKNYSDDTLGKGNKLDYFITNLDSIFTFKIINNNGITKYQCIKAYKL